MAVPPRHHCCPRYSLELPDEWHSSLGMGQRSPEVAAQPSSPRPLHGSIRMHDIVPRLQKFQEVMKSLYWGFQVPCPSFPFQSIAHVYSLMFKRLKSSTSTLSTIPNPYAVDLHWRSIWLYIAKELNPLEIARLVCVNKRTIRRYVTLFEQTGDVQPIS